jgi:hypothetical protein
VNAPLLATVSSLLILAAAPARAAESSAEAAVDLTKLRPGHPRLVALDADLSRIRELAKADETAAKYLTDLRGKAARLLGAEPVKYHLIGPRLLHVSREALDRLTTLGLVYRLDGRPEPADRAVQELLAICAFQDWHPSHFLDTAEMTHAAAIGYDWLFSKLTPDQRRTVRTALVQKGLLPAQQAYERRVGWSRCNHNWNQVCNGGISIGALAVADEEPELARHLLTEARQGIVHALRSYAPDGGWAEGPGYWHYATRYTVYYLAALESALGTDLGLKALPGLSKAGDLRVHATGPVELTFNYADARAAAGRAAEMFWLARAFDRPLYAWHERQCGGEPDAFDLLWFDPRGRGPKADPEPLDRHFQGVDVVFLRSAWEDRDAVFVGFKGGDNQANHAHLDLGSFVLDALGQRWALDLGADDYNLPGYFGGPRWTYYRLRTEGHNTLTFDGANQDPRAQAPLVAFRSTPTLAFGIADLSKASATTTRWWRGIALLDRREVLIQDEVHLKKPVEVVWTLHTEAAVQTSGATATLTRSNAGLRAVILEPTGAAFTTAPASPPKPQRPTPGVTRLLVRLPAVASARLTVLLTPYRGQPPEAPRRAVAPLAEWR